MADSPKAVAVIINGNQQNVAGVFSLTEEMHQHLLRKKTFGLTVTVKEDQPGKIFCVSIDD